MPVARVLDAADLTRVVGRISHEILEKSHGPNDLILLGVPRRGVPLAQRIAERMHSIEGVNVPVGSFSGRTIRAALDALNDIGRPRAVRLAVLIDRGHRELPIRADHVGKNIPTSRTEDVRVHLVETDGVDEVLLGPVEEDGA
jgi:pyrimidine operon attenuation protein/uracil phosphoribosyltransferase